MDLILEHPDHHEMQGPGDILTEYRRVLREASLDALQGTGNRVVGHREMLAEREPQTWLYLAEEAPKGHSWRV